VHGYWSIDLDILITTASKQLPAMVEQLRALRSVFDEDGHLHPKSAEATNASSS
jgi:hypothetical protein